VDLKNKNIGKEKPVRILYLVIAFLAVFAWLAGWIIYFGPVLINDEYTAIDYFYRVVSGGGFFPTPFKLHKPLSILMGASAWIFESALGYEILVAVFGAFFIIFFFLSVRRELGALFAAVCAFAILAHPDLMYYCATGSTIVPFLAFCFAGLYAALRRKESPKWLWVYAVCLLLGGLVRPEAWLFGGPAIIWWWPNKGDKKAWVRLFTALCIIGMGPVIWFGKDLLINDNLMHGINVATRDKEVGYGAPTPFLSSLNFFRVRISNKISWPVLYGAIAGMIMFIRSKGITKSVFHPFIVSPLMVSGYVLLIVYGGVYPVQRYYYFDALFAVIFCAFLIKTIISKTDIQKELIIKASLFFAVLLFTLGFVITRPSPGAFDGRWLMLVISGVCALLAMVLLWSRLLVEKPVPVLLTGLVVFLVLSFIVYSNGLWGQEFNELKLEAEKQKDMVLAAEFFDEAIPRDRGDRVMVPSRRNEQLDWLFRHREKLDVITFREAFYLKEAKNTGFLETHPDWLLYVHEDYQFWGPARMFGWLQTQNSATLRGIKIDLVKEFSTIRIFKVTYPDGHPPKQELPQIP
jgi:hypothetical protein